jgi:hypothetical protein
LAVTGKCPIHTLHLKDLLCFKKHLKFISV